MVLARLRTDYGPKYLWLLTAMYLGIKGYSAGVLRAVALPFFQRVHHVGLAEFHRMHIAAMVVPWCMKPLAGVLSDLVPIAGRRKTVYVWVCCVVAAICTFFIANNSWSAREAMILFAVVSSCIMMSDLLIEASYSEQLQRPGVRVSGNFVVTFVFGLVLIGGSVGALLVGLLADSGYITQIIWSAAPPFVVLGALAFGGYIPEGESSFSWEAVKARANLVTMCLVLSVAASVGAISLFSMSPQSQLGLTIFLAVTVIAMSYLCLDYALASCNSFLFLAEMLCINLTGATAYFYTDRCPGTPNFSYTFYTACGIILGGIFGLLGVFLFQKIQHNTLSQIFCGVTLVQIVVGTFELAQVSRLNIELGISDELVYVLGEAMVAPVVSMMLYLPMFILTSRLVTRGSEALTYAILAGTQNLGTMVSTTIGNYFIATYSIGNCNFEGLPTGVLIGKMVLPLMVVPLALVMLPHVRLAKK